MTSQKPHILVTRRLPETIEARMATLFETHVNEGDVTLTGDDIVEGVGHAEILSCSLNAVQVNTVQETT